MSDDFADHGWKDIIAADEPEIHSHNRKTFVGPAPVALAVGLSTN
jgi:hypothetical protein